MSNYLIWNRNWGRFQTTDPQPDNEQRFYYFFENQVCKNWKSKVFERLFSRNIGLGAQPQTAASTVHTWSNKKSIPKNGSTPILELESGLSKSYYKILSKIKYLRYLRFAQFVELPKIRFVLRVYDRWIGYVVPFFSQISVQRNEIFWLKDKTTLTKLSEKMLKTSKIVKNVRNRQQIQKKVKKNQSSQGAVFHKYEHIPQLEFVQPQMTMTLQKMNVTDAQNVAIYL